MNDKEREYWNGMIIGAFIGVLVTNFLWIVL
jgi:hypothetical protein